MGKRSVSFFYGTPSRMFSGQKFLLTKGFALKSEANNYANGLRKMGYLARVNKEGTMLGRVMYFVYRRGRHNK